MTIFPQLICSHAELKIETTTGRKALKRTSVSQAYFFMNITKQEAIGESISFPSIIANNYSRFHCFVQSADDFSRIFRHAKKSGPDFSCNSALALTLVVQI